MWPAGVSGCSKAPLPASLQTALKIGAVIFSEDATLVLLWLLALGELEAFWQELPAKQSAAVQILTAFRFSVDFVLTLFLHLKKKKRGKKKHTPPMSIPFFFFFFLAVVL